MQSEREQEARSAAETLLRHSSQNYGSTSNFSSGSSFNNENVSSPRCCPQFCIVSHVRRTFCLIVTFDLLLSFLLWAIFVKLKDGNFFAEILKEFTLYKFETSLMDFLIVATCRFLILTFFYGLFKIRNPSAVAVTTLLTCVYTLLKIVFFQSSNYFCYVLLGESFIISWVETWFLDFRVLPLESSNERRLLDLEGILSIQGIGRKLLNSAEAEGFITPSEGSDEDEDPLLNSKDAEYYKKAKDAWKLGLTLLETNHGWKRENEASNIIVHSQQVKNLGKIFRAEAKINGSLEETFNETSLCCERIPTWNKSVIESKVIKKINESSDLIYQVAKKTANGLISSRDFVSARYWKQVDEASGTMLAASTSVDLPWLPHEKPHIRGETKLAAWMYKRLPNNSCLIKVLLGSDIKGWVPQKVIDQALSSVIIETLQSLQTHMNSINRV